MKWRIKSGNILDEPAEILICSANVYLNLSGGVGGEILLRYGDSMQQELHQYLKEHHRQFVQQGDVVPAPPCGTPYKAVLHAVAVDGFYQSSPQVIESLVVKSLKMASSLMATKVALVALGTGYGHLSLSDFARGLVALMEQEFPPIQEVFIVVRKSYEAMEISTVLPHVLMIK